MGSVEFVLGVADDEEGYPEAFLNVDIVAFLRIVRVALTGFGAAGVIDSGNFHVSEVTLLVVGDPEAFAAVVADDLLFDVAEFDRVVNLGDVEGHGDGVHAAVGGLEAGGEPEGVAAQHVADAFGVAVGGRCYDTGFYQVDAATVLDDCLDDLGAVVEFPFGVSGDKDDGVALDGVEECGLEDFLDGLFEGFSDHGGESFLWGGHCHHGDVGFGDLVVAGFEGVPVGPVDDVHLPEGGDLEFIVRYCSRDPPVGGTGPGVEFDGDLSEDAETTHCPHESAHDAAEAGSWSVAAEPCVAGGQRA